MKRFYYNDPLAAAWMAKHFGMKFQDWTWNDEVFVFENDDVELEDTTLYIRPDNLHLLELQEGDLVTPISGWRPKQAQPWDIEAIRNGERAGFKRGYRVIQRKGIPFHWPESEEVS